MPGYINIGIQCDLQPVISTHIATFPSESELSEMDEKMINVSTETSFVPHRKSNIVVIYYMKLLVI